MTANIRQQLTVHGVDLRLNTSVTEIREDENSSKVVLSDGNSVECGLVVLSVGVRPEVKLAREAGLSIGERGGIVVDAHMRTSDPNIFAAGDAVEVTDFVGGFATLIPLAGPANRQGRIAADNAFGRESIYKGTQGTAICKVFDTVIGMTGLSEKGLKRAEISYEKVYDHPANHATYYPGAGTISLKLLFSPDTGRILGAQAAGTEGVDKRIDVLAVAIRAGMTVFDLEHLELSYAPPFGSAKDPVNMAGFVASNVIKGDMNICHVEDVVNLDDDHILIDVRTRFEHRNGSIPGSVNIPVDNLRDRLDEIPKDKKVLVTCQVGMRGYIACRILKQHGYSCRNQSGGYATYMAFQNTLR
ncbi:Coenzyme A disulfide reductase [subsurface metagenome]